MNYLVNISEELSEIQADLEKIKNKELSNDQIVYLGLQLRELQSTIRALKADVSEIKSNLKSTNIIDKIAETEMDLQNNSEFFKTFMPLMILYNMGMINRNW